MHQEVSIKCTHKVFLGVLRASSRIVLCPDLFQKRDACVWQVFASSTAVSPLQHVPIFFHSGQLSADLPDLERRLAVEVKLRVGARFLNSFQKINHLDPLPTDNKALHQGSELLFLSGAERCGAGNMS